MNVKKLLAPALFAALGMGAMLVSSAIADAPKKESSKNEAKPADKPELKLPPGWTAADLEACIVAGTPGKMHAHLTKGAGVWLGKTTMWMGPGGETAKSECTSTITPMMDGRYIKCEMSGDMPGMGPYNGMGIYGFDNVSQQFTCTWIDNHSAGMMNGVGKLSADGKTTTWKFTYNCPINKKPAVLREVETITGAKTKTLETFGADPKSGKEYKMMSIEFTKK